MNLQPAVASNDDEVEFSHVRTREERDAEGFANAIDLDADDAAPKKKRRR